MSRRQTQTIGGTHGREFTAPPGDNDISRLSFYTAHERLKGIKVVYSDGYVQSIGNTHGDSFRRLNAASDPIRTVVVYTDQQSSEVLGIRIGQQSRTVSVFGNESEYTRSFRLSQESRLVGISGRHQDDCVVAISFVYFASSNAFEPGAREPNRDESQEAKDVDPGNTPSQTQSTGSWKFDTKSATSVLQSLGCIIGAGLIIRGAVSAVRKMTKPRDPESSSSDDDDDRCRNPY